MKVTATYNPIIYSNAFGDGQFMGKIKGFVEKQKGEGGIVSKVKGFVEKVKDKGQGGTMSQTVSPAPVQAPTQPPLSPKPPGMSQGLKIGLWVGGGVVVLGLVGLAIYAATKGNK